MTNRIEIAPRPNATGAPDSSVASVTASTISPCVVGAHRTTPARAADGPAQFMPRLPPECRTAASRPVTRHAMSDRILQRQQAEPDRHRRVRNPQPRAPHRVRDPAVVPRLLPEQERHHRHHGAERDRQHAANIASANRPRGREVQRQHVDVDVAARQQHVRAADERRRGDAVRDEVGLPDRALVQHVADEHHVADDDDGERDEPGGDVAAQPRHAA